MARQRAHAPNVQQAQKRPHNEERTRWHNNARTELAQQRPHTPSAQSNRLVDCASIRTCPPVRRNRSPAPCLCGQTSKERRIDEIRRRMTRRAAAFLGPPSRGKTHGAQLAHSSINHPSSFQLGRDSGQGSPPVTWKSVTNALSKACRGSRISCEGGAAQALRLGDAPRRAGVTSLGGPGHGWWLGRYEAIFREAVCLASLCRPFAG